MAEDLSRWIGKKETRYDTVALSPAQRMLATLDDMTTELPEGSPLPLLWHWLYFLSDAPMSAIGPDGHPKRGGFLPPVELPYRMFAGARFIFHSPLLIGKKARRESKILSIDHKEGRDGPLIFVNISHEIFQGGKLCMEEQCDLVYLGARAPHKPASSKGKRPELNPRAIVKTITPDPVLLFRFSALTFNSHRIHYDRPYAVSEEGYPNLVVHGPLVAVLLMELVRKHIEAPVQAFSFKGRAPLFEGAPFRLIAIPDDGRVVLRAEGPDGSTATEAEALVNTNKT